MGEKINKRKRALKQGGGQAQTVKKCSAVSDTCRRLDNIFHMGKDCALAILRPETVLSSPRTTDKNIGRKWSSDNDAKYGSRSEKIHLRL